MDKEKIIKHLNNSIERRVPDVWETINTKINNNQFEKEMYQQPVKKQKKLSRKISIAAAVMVAFSVLSFSPAMATFKAIYNQIFVSDHIDDTGLKNALNSGEGQLIDQTYYDKDNDIIIKFNSIMMDDKETKLLLTYHSEKKNLKNYYVDLFEGKSSIYVIADGSKIELDNVGWGSRYYDEKENVVSEALSFESLDHYEGKKIKLEINDVTLYEDNKRDRLPVTWTTHFELNKTAISKRENVNLNKEFMFNNETYTIKNIEFSSLETRLIVTGTDIKPYIDQDGNKYETKSKLELMWLNARKVDKDHGYTVNPKKDGIFLRSGDELVVPIFSKGELKTAEDEYFMIFDPVKNRRDVTLEVGKDIKIDLLK